MSSGFQNPITIKEAIDKIYNRQYLLPAIQRKFTWKSEQIEMLFDSILQGYPINSFMFWNISNSEIKNNYKFYEFITNYREFFAENNKDIDTKGVSDFEAVIDGQQRLTSLYIGLKGTYAYKLPRKWWKDCEECIPTRKLYLNLSERNSQEHDNQKVYDFRFLTKNEFEKFNSHQIWFEVGDIIKMDTISKVTKYINQNNLINNEYAFETLEKLFQVIHMDRLINYYLQKEQEPDKVLEIFIRTNSGGTPLSFSDLLMSIASANWTKIDARKEMERLISEVYDLSDGFKIDKDFILKTCLVLFIDDIRFQLKNFTYENVQIFEDNWEEIKNSINSAFILFKDLGFNNKNFRAKNVAIPIIYYIYYNNLSQKIINPLYSIENKSKIKNWILLTFIKSIFSGQTDNTLKKMRDVLKQNINGDFPNKLLMDIFKGDPTKNYNFDDEFIDGILESEKDSYEAIYILYLLYSHLDYDNKDFHQDHLHPAIIFKDKERLKDIPKKDREFALQSKNWNGIANLQLLNGRLNESKNDMPLIDWVNKYNKTNEELYLSNNISLDIKNFKNFIINRKENIKKYLKSIMQ